MPFAPALAGEDVFDIPQSSPEKPKKRPVRGTKVVPKSQPQQTTNKTPLRERGRPIKATVGQITAKRLDTEAPHGQPKIVDTVEFTDDDVLQKGSEDSFHRIRNQGGENLGSQRPDRYNRISKDTFSEPLRGPRVESPQSLTKRSTAVHPVSDGVLLSGRKGSPKGARSRRGETHSSLRSGQQTQLSKATLRSPVIRNPNTETQQNLSKQPNGGQPANKIRLQDKSKNASSESHRRRGEALSSPEKRRKGMLDATSPELPETSTSMRGSPRRSRRLAKRELEKGSSRPPTNGIDSSPKVMAKPKLVHRKARTNSEATDRDELDGEAQCENHRDDIRREASQALETTIEEDTVRPEDITHENDGNDDSNGTHGDDVANKRNNDAAQSDNARLNSDIALGDGAAQESDSRDSDAERASVSELEQEEEPRFECFGQYRNWLLIKDAAASIGIVETDKGPRRKKARVRTTFGRDLFPVIRHLTSLYDELAKSSSEERWQALTQTSEGIEIAYRELRERIKRADTKSLKSEVAEFTSEVYQAFVPCLMYLLESAMIALSPIYVHNEENPSDTISLDSLKRVAHLQSLILQLCNKAKSWRAAYVKERKIKDVGRTTKEILPILRDRLKPAFDREHTKREREVKERERITESERIAEEEEARVQAEIEGKRARLAEIKSLQIRQLQNAQRWNRALVFGGE